MQAARIGTAFLLAIRELGMIMRSKQRRVLRARCLLCAMGCSCAVCMPHAQQLHGGDAAECTLLTSWLITWRCPPPAHRSNTLYLQITLHSTQQCIFQRTRLCSALSYLHIPARGHGHPRAPAGSPLRQIGCLRPLDGEIPKHPTAVARLSRVGHCSPEGPMSLRVLRLSCVTIISADCVSLNEHHHKPQTRPSGLIGHPRLVG